MDRAITCTGCGRVLNVSHPASAKMFEERVAERTSVLKTSHDLLEKVVLQRTKDLREAALALTRAEHEERRRLAHVLHDNLQQLMCAAKMRLGILGMTKNNNASIHEQVAEISSLLQDAIDASCSLAHELSPPTLREQGLAAALEWLAGWMRDKHRLAVEVVYDGAKLTADGTLNTFLFESVRELLFNVTKHALVPCARVIVEHTENGWLRVHVEDDGPGFDPAALKPGAGFGLFSIRERARFFAGSFDIDSAPGRGSRFTLLVPLIDKVV